MKRTIAIIFIGSLLFVLLCAGCMVNSGSAGELALRVNPLADCPQTQITCLQTEAGEYCLFLPSDADRGALYVEYEGSVIRCGGEALPNKAVTDLFASADEFTLTQRGKSFVLRVLQSENLPAVYVASEKELSWLHEDKNNKSSGSIIICENGAIVTQTALKHIKGRGNSTWDLEPWESGGEKRPYNIKLEQEQSLLGMPSAKKWRLLANALDRYYICNELGLFVGREMGLECALDCRPVDLYINGNYRGNYLLTESIDVGEGHIEINDTQTLNEQANAPIPLDSFVWQKEFNAGGQLTAQWRQQLQTPAQSEWAYLVERIDKKAQAEDFGSFRTSRNNWYEMKNPEDASESQVRYVAELFERAEAALYAPDDDQAEEEDYTEYVDVDSLVQVWLTHELMINLPARCESTFFYVPQGSETVFSGPVWDFDQTGSGDYSDDWYLCDGRTDVCWFSAAFRHADFRTAAVALWRRFAAEHTPQALRDEVIALVRKNTASIVMDRYRWGGQGNSPEATAQAYGRLGIKLAQVFSQRAAWMNGALSEDRAFLWFVRSDDQFCMYPVSLPQGSVIAVPTGTEEIYADFLAAKAFFSDEAILCWAENPDGSGRRYAPGDSVTLTEAAMTLYAVYG